MWVSPLSHRIATFFGEFISLPYTIDTFRRGRPGPKSCATSTHMTLGMRATPAPFAACAFRRATVTLFRALEVATRAPCTPSLAADPGPWPYPRGVSKMCNCHSKCASGRLREAPARAPGLGHPHAWPGRPPAVHAWPLRPRGYTARLVPELWPAAIPTPARRAPRGYTARLCPSPGPWPHPRPAGGPPGVYSEALPEHWPVATHAARGITTAGARQHPRPDAARGKTPPGAGRAATIQSPLDRGLGVDNPKP